MTKDTSNNILNLEAKHAELNEAQKSYGETIIKQAEYFKEVAQKVEPVIKFLKEKNYNFSNPEQEYKTKSGAVLAVTDNSVYCYTHGDLIVKHERNDFDEYIKMPIDHALMEIKLSTAVKGLLYVLQIQKEAIKYIIKEQQKLVDDLESLKKKF